MNDDPAPHPSTAQTTLTLPPSSVGAEVLFSGFKRAVQGDRRALARAVSRIEDRADGVLEAVGGLRPRRRSGPASPHVIGLTGPPGAGKSTFTNRLVREARERGQRVAVLAVDPSSPFSGGAILGDRLRMEEHAADPAVFIRSLASRGHLGGLSRATGQVVDLLDAAGFDLILVETVGVGQSELSVMEVADTVIVVLTPESGDTVQTMKAGLLEVADVFVVNKADRPGADRLRRDLEQMVRLDGEVPGSSTDWTPPVLTTCATEGTGVSDVARACRAHLGWISGAGLADWERRRAAGRLRTFLDLIAEDAREAAASRLRTTALSERRGLEAGELNPYLLAAAWGRS